MNTTPIQSVPMTQPILDDGIDSTIISEPPSPPRSYAPYSVSQVCSYPNSGQTTAVNSIIHQEGVIPDSIATPKVKTKARSFSKLEAAEEKPVDRSRLTRVKVHLMDEIDTHIACIPLAFFCFLTGYTDAISLIAAYVSTAFQTGNTIMGSMALAKLFTKYPHALVNSPTAIPEDALWNPVGAEQWSWHKDHRLLKPDAQALVSFICFMLGALSGRLADRIGPKRRIWLVSSGILGALLTLAAALCSWANHQSSFASGRGSTFVNWTTTLGYCTIGFASAAMGIQAFTGMRIGNAFNSTIVFTLVWIQLLCDPKLFERRAVISRDHRAISLVALMLGALSGRAIVDVIGTHWALGIGAGLRLLVAFSWLAIPRQK